MKTSSFGERFAAPSGISLLMEDLGSALVDPNMLMLGGGNPAHIPEVQAVWRERMQTLLGGDGADFDRTLADYTSPRGAERFLSSVADFLRARYGWDIGPENIAITNGGQTAMFCLLNMFSGTYADGGKRKILFPLMPEYIGYANQSLEADCYVGRRPTVEELGHREFKYHVDFDALPIDEQIGAICVSRPTNPSGNVLTDAEILRLAQLAEAKDIPLIVDNAYGNPFPGIVFNDASPYWGANTVLTFSLSKIGLPGARTGIVVAPPHIIDAIGSMNSIVSLANGNIGPAIVAPLIDSGEILRLADEVVRPYYRARSERARDWVREYFPEDVDYAMHRGEGALFLWMCFRDLPITCKELYTRLKARGVLVVPGEYFFFGLETPWADASKCIRITFAQHEDVVREGLRRIGDELREIYTQTR